MDTFNFNWKPEYRGTWNCPSCGNEIYGTLKITQGDIILELLCHSCHKIEGIHLESITGRVDSLDANNVLAVKLCNLSLVSTKDSMGEGFSTYKYVAEDIFATSDINALSSPIKTVRFFSDYIGLWSKKHYANNIVESFNAHGIKLEYNQPEPYKCFEDESILVELFCSIGRKTPNHQGYILNTKHSLDITFKEPSEDFYRAKVKAFQMSYLFSLLIQRPVDIGNIFYLTDKGTFIHRNGLRYRNVIIRETPFTSNNFADLTSEKLNSMVSKWLSYYQKYANSLDSFFEIWNHELLPSEQRFKGYMSVLDGLTKDLSVECEEKPSNREKTILQYWPTFKNVLEKHKGISASDLHKFDMALTGKKETKNAPILNRFWELIKILGSVLPPNIDKNFAKKGVYTRHKLTHPESRYKMVFTPSQLPQAIHKLEIILCSYMLKVIGAKDDLIIRTLWLDAHKTIIL